MWQLCALYIQHVVWDHSSFESFQPFCQLMNSSHFPSCWLVLLLSIKMLKYLPPKGKWKIKKKRTTLSLSPLFPLYSSTFTSSLHHSQKNWLSHCARQLQTPLKHWNVVSCNKISFDYFQLIYKKEDYMDHMDGLINYLLCLDEFDFKHQGWSWGLPSAGACESQHPRPPADTEQSKVKLQTVIQLLLWILYNLDHYYY